MLTEIAAHQPPFSIELGAPFADVALNASFPYRHHQVHLQLNSIRLGNLLAEIKSELISDGRTLAILRSFNLTRYIDQIRHLSHSRKVRIAAMLSELQAKQLLGVVNKEYVALATKPSLIATSFAIREWRHAGEERLESILPFWQTPLAGKPHWSSSLHPYPRIHRG
jgi:hypothetical protein